MEAKTEYQVEEITDAAAWESFLVGSPQRTVFAQNWFLETLPVKSRRFFVSRGESPVLALLLFESEKGEILAGSQPYSMYQGFYFSKEFAEAPVHSRATSGRIALEAALAELAVKFPRLFFVSHWAAEDMRAFSWFNYHQPELGRFAVDLYYTGIVPLHSGTTFEAYLKSLRKSRRQEWRKKEELELRLQSCSKLEPFYSAYASTFERQGISISADQFQRVRAITESALEKKQGELVGCYKGESLISAALFLFDNRHSYYLFGANDSNYRHLPGGTLVVLEGVRRALERGLSGLDVCGMNSPSRGDFKAGFGAELFPYFQLKWVRP